nr:unnamed protein product [Digitaria exilis]
MGRALWRTEQSEGLEAQSDFYWVRSVRSQPGAAATSWTLPLPPPPFSSACSATAAAKNPANPRPVPTRAAGNPRLPDPWIRSSRSPSATSAESCVLQLLNRGFKLEFGPEIGRSRDLRDRSTLHCGAENTLKPGDVIQCRECGYHILYKKRTRRNKCHRSK